MNAADPLEQLRDIHLPEAIPWWPLAPGWWLLAFLTIGLLALALTWFLRRRRSARYRREALAALQQLSSSEPDETIHQISIALRRTAKTAFPAQRWEALPTAAMLQQLNRCNTDICFGSELIGRLSQTLYRSDSNVDQALAADYRQAAGQWIQNHRQAMSPTAPLGETQPC